MFSPSPFRSLSLRLALLFAFFVSPSPSHSLPHRLTAIWCFVAGFCFGLLLGSKQDCLGEKVVNKGRFLFFLLVHLRT